MQEPWKDLKHLQHLCKSFLILTPDEIDLVFVSTFGILALEPHTQHIFSSPSSFPMHMKQYHSPSGMLKKCDSKTI
jgi:hypothetical protein